MNKEEETATAKHAPVPGSDARLHKWVDGVNKYLVQKNYFNDPELKKVATISDEDLKEMANPELKATH